MATVFFWTVLSLIIMFWILILFSCIKVAARADRIADTFLFGEEGTGGKQSKAQQGKYI